MALKIRLSRAGAKKRPFYRIVVADSRSPRDGRYLERLGTYDPMLPKDSTERIKLNEPRIKHWLGMGAQPSDRVARFLGGAEIIPIPAQRNNPNKAKPKAKAAARAEERAEKAKALAEAPEAPVAPEVPEAAEEAPAAEPTAEAETEEGGDDAAKEAGSEG